MPRGSVGIIIGRDGAMIKKIQTDTGARVQFKDGELQGENGSFVESLY